MMTPWFKYWYDSFSALSVSFCFNFWSRWHRGARKGPHALHPVSQQSPQGYRRSSVNVCLVVPSSFPISKGRMSATSFLHSSFLQAINAVVLWPLHVWKVPQASKHLCSAKLQNRCDVSCACQSICPPKPSCACPLPVYLPSHTLLCLPVASLSALPHSAVLARCKSICPPTPCCACQSICPPTPQVLASLSALPHPRCLPVYLPSHTRGASQSICPPTPEVLASLSALQHPRCLPVYLPSNTRGACQSICPPTPEVLASLSAFPHPGCVPQHFITASVALW